MQQQIVLIIPGDVLPVLSPQSFVFSLGANSVDIYFALSISSMCIVPNMNVVVSKTHTSLEPVLLFDSLLNQSLYIYNPSSLITLFKFVHVQKIENEL